MMTENLEKNPYFYRSILLTLLLLTFLFTNSVLGANRILKKNTHLKSSSLKSSRFIASASKESSPDTYSKNRSNEWQSLPKQSWETFQTALPPEIDPLGFDSRNKIIFHSNSGFETQAIPATEKIPFLGQIIGSRSESQFLSMGDTVYIRGDNTLQLGQTYAITQEPTLLKSTKSDRIGYSYLIMGKVKLLGVRDKIFIGSILSSRHFIPRGTSLIQDPPRIPVMAPLPAPQAIKGIVMIDPNFSTHLLAQHKEVFIDRGSDDGVKPGMIFRAYEHYDPSNDKKITSSNFIIDADIQVTHITETFSMGIIIQNMIMIKENTDVILLTDVSDLSRNRGFREKGDDKESNPLNELDQLDDQGGLGKQEKKELKQLEKWKDNETPTLKTLETTPPPPESAKNTPLSDTQPENLKSPEATTELRSESTTPETEAPLPETPSQEISVSE